MSNKSVRLSQVASTKPRIITQAIRRYLDEQYDLRGSRTYFQRSFRERIAA